MTSTVRLAQGTRVSIPADSSATRYFVLGYEGETARLVGTNANATDFVNEENVTHVPADSIEADRKIVKTRLAGAWLRFEAARG